MKLKLSISVISLAIIVFIAVYQTFRVHNQKNNIDHLESLANYIKSDIEESRTIYYVSNNNSSELYFKTQFAFVPNVVINKNYDEIPNDSLIIFVFDNTAKSDKYLDSLVIDENKLSSISDLHYMINLTVKK